MPIPQKWTLTQKEALISKLENYLSAYELAISIDLREQPMKIIEYIDGVVQEPIYLWIDKIIAHTPRVGDLEAHIDEQFLDIQMISLYGMQH